MSNGFDNSVIIADGIDLSGNSSPVNQLNTDGFLLIGSSTGNPGSGLITSSDGSITVTPGDGTLDLVAVGGGSGDVTASANLTDNTIIRGDGGAKGVQDSGVTLNDTNDLSGINDLTLGGDIAVTGTVDGRDVAADGTKLDGIEALADVTDATNVAAAGALMADGSVALAGAWDMGSQATTNVNIDSGSITGITDLAVADGGTGASTLTGVLTGNGTGAITGAAVTQYGVLVGDASNAVTSTAVGTAGDVLTSNGAGLAPTYQTPTVGTVTSVSGTSNRISSTGGATPVIDVDAAYVGQASITTLGTVTTGTWNGTTVAVANGGTGASTLTGVLTGNGTGAITGAAVTQYGVLIGDASNAVTSTAVGTAGDVLTSNGAGLAPTYQTPTVGTVTSVSGTSNRISSTGGATPVIDIDSAYVGQTSITTLGTVTNGTWSATDVAVDSGGTGRSSHTAYAVLCGGTTTTAAQQSIASVGTSGQVLTSNGAGALPTMQDAAGGSSPLTTKGDIYTYDTADARLAIGTDDYCLIADSAATTGNKWGILQEVGGGTGQSSYTTGDILYSSATNTLSNLGIGTFGNDLTSTVSGIPGYKSRKNWVTIYDDFMHWQIGDWTRGNSGSGSASTFAIAPSDANHPGQWRGETGTTTSGHGRLQYYEDCMRLGGGQMLFETCVKLTTLSDVTDTYTMRVGLSDNTSGDDGTDAVLFRYTHGTHSGNWDLVTRASSSETSTDSSTAVTTDWTSLAILVNAAGTLVTYYVDGSSVGTSSTNIPTSTLGPYVAIKKSAGTTERNMFCDYINLNMQLTNAR